MPSANLEKMALKIMTAADKPKMEERTIKDVSALLKQKLIL